MDRRRIIFRPCLSLFLVAAASASLVVAADSSPASAPADAQVDLKQLIANLNGIADDATLAELSGILQVVEAPAALSDAQKIQWRDRRGDMLIQLDTAVRLRAKAVDWETDARDAPNRMSHERQRLHANADPELDPSKSLVQLEQELSQRQAELSAAQEEFNLKKAELNRRPTRRIEIPKLVSANATRLEEIDKFLSLPIADDQPEELRSIERGLLLAERLAKRIEIESLQKELLNYDATAEVILLERDRAARDVSRGERALKGLRDVVADRRKAEAERSAREAQAVLERAKAAGAHPALQALARDNAQLAEERKQFENKLQQMEARLERDQARSSNLIKYFDEMQAKDKLADVSNRTALLHKQERMLPDERAVRKTLRELSSELAEAQLALFEYTEQGSSLADPDREIDRLLAEIPSHGPVNRLVLRQVLRQQVETKRENLNALAEAHSRYIQYCSQLQDQWETLWKRCSEYRDYLAARVLWVRSTAPLEAAQFADFKAAAVWTFDPRGWTEVGHCLLQDVIGNPLIWIAGLPACVGLIVARGRLRARIRELGAIAARGHTDTFRPTALALLCTGVVSLVWPALCAFLGWRLATGAPEGHANSLGMGLLITVLAILPLELLRQVCRPLGLADSHFDWPHHGVSLLRRNVRRLTIIGMPVVLWTAMLHVHGEEDWINSVGRVMFIIAMAAVARFIQRVLRPTGGVLEETLACYRGQWLDRLRWLWYPVSVGAPLALAGLAAAGFYYTAMQLAWRLEATIEMLVGLLLLHASLLRLLLVVRRKLAMEQARSRRAAMCEQREHPTVTPAEAPAPTEAERLDLAVVSLQTRQLLQSAIVCGAMVGLCAIWVDVLPALKRLNDLELWSTAWSTITLGHLLMALLVGAMTFLAARNIPGLLEMTVLQRLPLQAGSGYAITTICRYLIVIAGLTWASSQLGLQWNHVQWLVAAISVGLGFGLQEIFGNFISGLIILFERPIRVGDTITVGQVSGTVSRIRIRATTIVDGDRKELIVPNKEFITGQVVNWTLSDETTRVGISVRIPFGADASLAQRLMLKAAQSHPSVLQDPAPSAWLENFGESWLELQLNVFLPNPGLGSRTKHELIDAISHSFLKAGIQPAMPQRTIVLQSSEPVRSAFEARKSA